MFIVFLLLVGFVVYGIGVAFDVNWWEVFRNFGVLWDGDKWITMPE
jgi:hypothetical protein